MKWLIVIAIALSITLTAGTQLSAQAENCPSGALPMRAGDNLQSLVNVSGDGAVFCLEAGTYRRASITPRDGQGFVANGVVIFDGEGATEIAFNGVVEPNNPTRNAEGVWVSGIMFVNYRTGNFNGKAVLIPSEGWVIENVIIRDSTSGIRGGNVNWACASGFILRDTLLENISHAALFWNATYGLTERVTVRNSGYGMSRDDADWLGIVKYQNQPIWRDGSFSSTLPCPTQTGAQLIIQDSTFENLNSVGWWCDISCRDLVFRRNVVRDNQWSGLMFEISGGGHTGATSNLIEGNTFSCNRRGNTASGGWGGAEIFLPNANGIIVRNNVITVCPNGRAFSFVYEAWRSVPTRDILIENNLIRMQGAPVYAANGEALRSLISVTCCDSSWMRSANIAWRGNRYEVQALNGDYFEYGARYGWAGWQSVTGESGTFAQLSQVPTPTIDPSLPTLTPSLTPTRAPTLTPSATFTPAPPTLTATPRPPVQLPAVIEAEHFNTAFDNGAGNFFGVNVRPDHPNVDIKSTSDSYAIGLFEGGEWFEIVGEVREAGIYSIRFVGGGAESGRALFVTVDGVGAGTIPAPPLASWSAPYQTSSALIVSLNAGQVRLRFGAAPGYVDVDKVIIEALGTATPQPPTLTPSVTSSPAPTFTSTPTQSVTEVTVSPGATATMQCYYAVLNEYALGELCLEARP